MRAIGRLTALAVGHVLVVALVGVIGGCAKNDPTPTPLDGHTDGARDGAPLADADGFFADGQPGCWPWHTLVDVAGDKPSCVGIASDYRPADSSNDSWPACISDDNTYHRIVADISSIGRVAGFESIAGKLLSATPPAAQDFLAARVVYSEPEGLDSRVSRREDEHVPAPAKACADMTPAEITANAERCVGQAQIQPLLNRAFADGARGQEPFENAARVEAGLLWFLYLSTHKEATSCAQTSKDCDSSYAYYSGGEARTGGKGLSRYVRSVSPQAHDRAFDGILALRCWRDLDPDVPAKDLARRDQAITQMDRALLRGIALLVKARAAALPIVCAQQQHAAWISVALLGAVLGRAARASNSSLATALANELASPSPPSNTAKLQALLEGLFACP